MSRLHAYSLQKKLLKLETDYKNTREPKRFHHVPPLTMISTSWVFH